MTRPASPYVNRAPNEWAAITEGLVAAFPLDAAMLVSVVHDAWDDLYTSSIGRAKLIIGADVFLPAQATGVLLERLIANELHRRNSQWRSGISKDEKDVVSIEDDCLSFEIKTSSSKAGLYGNRSTGHRAEGRRKYRTGYYLVVNYKPPIETDKTRWIWNIRFGWIDDEDWTGQAQPTGQQASVSRDVARFKLISLFSSNGE